MEPEFAFNLMLSVQPRDGEPRSQSSLYLNVYKPPIRVCGTSNIINILSGKTKEQFQGL